MSGPHTCFPKVAADLRLRDMPPPSFSLSLRLSSNCPISTTEHVCHADSCVTAGKMTTSITRTEFGAFLEEHAHLLVPFGYWKYKANGRGAVLVGFSSLQSMEAHVMSKDFSDAVVTFARSANELPYEPEEEVYVVVGVANAEGTMMERKLYETTLYYECEHGHKTSNPSFR